MRFKIGDKTYAGDAMDKLSLWQLLQLEQQTKALGHPLTMAEVQRISAEIDALKTEQEKQNHPDAPWMLAVTIWTTRNLAGEELEFSAAINFPLKELVFLPDPQDHKSKANPTKARKVSGQPAGLAVELEATT